MEGWVDLDCQKSHVLDVSRKSSVMVLMSLPAGCSRHGDQQFYEGALLPTVESLACGTSRLLELAERNVRRQGRCGRSFYYDNASSHGIRRASNSVSGRHTAAERDWTKPRHLPLQSSRHVVYCDIMGSLVTPDYLFTLPKHAAV